MAVRSPLKLEFLHPMRKYEKVLGWIYVPIHIVALQFILSAVYMILLETGTELSDADLNAMYYGVGMVYIFLTMFRFLKASFHDLCDNLWRSFLGIAQGYCWYMILATAAVSAISMIMGSMEWSNPNMEIIGESALVDRNSVLAVSVIMAPIVEEVIFRGVIHGSLRKKSKILAYVVSTLVFAVYHLWSFMLVDFDWYLVVLVLQYIPGGLALALCYERGRNIWASIFLHAFINWIAFSAM